jgi:hypothetical protein
VLSKLFFQSQEINKNDHQNIYFFPIVIQWGGEEDGYQKIAEQKGHY